MRAAHRAALLQHLTDLGESLHGVVATATLLRRRALNQQDLSAWITRGQTAAEQLKKVRPAVRYTLDGLDEPIRVLSRLPEWAATYRDVELSGAEELLEAGRKLAGCIDDTVRKSYRTGLPPDRLARRRVSRLARLVRQLWGVRFLGPPPGALHPIRRRKYWREGRTSGVEPAETPD